MNKRIKRVKVPVSSTLPKALVSRSFQLLLLVFLSLLFFQGCTSSLKYNAGLYTQRVTGNFSTENANDSEKSFILVLDYHRTLMETSEGYLNRVTAFLAYPDQKGNYSVPFATDSVKLELTFYAHNSHMVVQEFRRSLGVGSYEFNTMLVEDQNWNKTYYLMIKPTLIGYITEKRYLMSQRDKLYIGEWLSSADEHL